MPKADLGHRLRQVRHYRGLSQGRLAKRIGISVGTIQAYEHGRARVTVDRLLVLAAALGCEPAELLALPSPPARSSSPGVAEPFLQGPCKRAEGDQPTPTRKTQRMAPTPPRAAPFNRG
jgi:transcriptional regulator with XRE-family HTH domain